MGIESFNPPWDVFFLPLFNLLVALYSLPFVDFAIAIILFTIIIRTILAPLFIRQIGSQKEMQRMQPLVREVQRKHKGNRQEVYEETQALYEGTRGQPGRRLPAGPPPAADPVRALAGADPRLGPINFTPSEGRSRRSTTGSSVPASSPSATTLRGPGLRAVRRPRGDVEPAPNELPTDHPGQARRVRGYNDQLASNLDLAMVDNVFAITLFGGFALWHWPSSRPSCSSCRSR